MSEALLRVCEHARAQLLREAKLAALSDAVLSYREVVHPSVQALKLVADGRDAYAYHRVGEELGVDWGFSDPDTTCDLARRLNRISLRRPHFSALACASKTLAEHLGPNKELEQAVLWLRDVSFSEDDIRDCADLLDAAAAVVDYQLAFGAAMEVTAMCPDGSSLRDLASGFRKLADAIA